METYAYYHGTWQAAKDIRLPLTERSVFFGDAIYDAALAHRGRILLAEEHLDRFYRSAGKLGISCPVSRPGLLALLEEGASKGETVFLYFQLTRTSEERVHAYPDGASGSLLITASESQLPLPDERAALITVPDRRYGFCDVKTVNLLPNVLAAKEAEARGADEAVFVREGKVTECAHSNIFILKNGTLFTHPEDCRILPGTVRRAFIRAACETGVPTVEFPFTVEEAKNADAVFVTSTSKLIRTAKTLDETVFGPAPALADHLVFALFSSVFRGIL